MSKIKVHIINLKNDITIEKNISLKEILKECNFDRDFLVAKVDNIEKDLNFIVKNSCNVEFLDIKTKQGYKAYQRSVMFIMLAAVNKVLGSKRVVWVEHTLNNNFICRIKNFELERKQIEDIKSEMERMIRENVLIEKFQLPISEAEEIFERNNLINCKKELKYIKATNVTIYKIGEYYDYLYGSMVISAGYIKNFDIEKYQNGFILKIQAQNNPENLNGYVKGSKISSVFSEYNRWSEIMKTEAVCSLNDAICNGKIKELILIAEALQEKKIAQIADLIYKSGKKFIFVAGPSSSGKTTFAKRLSIQLKVIGIKPHMISLDDYYKNRKDIPFEADGSKNYENITTLKIERFNEDLLKLKKGEEVETCLYDFITGEEKPYGKKIKLEKGEVLIIEGIHGLNDELTPKIEDKDKFKIYISALTQLNIDEHNRISTTDSRLIRRIVRDHFFRGFSINNTIEMWPKVLKGEEDNIFPYQENADVIFNSALIYELCVLKVYAEPLLFSVDKAEGVYTEAKRLLNMLNSFLAINPEDIPNNSLIREFIGGSCFE